MRVSEAKSVQVNAAAAKRSNRDEDSGEVSRAMVDRSMVYMYSPGGGGGDGGSALAPSGQAGGGMVTTEPEERTTKEQPGGHVCRGQQDASSVAVQSAWRCPEGDARGSAWSAWRCPEGDARGRRAVMSRRQSQVDVREWKAPRPLLKMQAGRR